MFRRLLPVAVLATALVMSLVGAPAGAAGLPSEKQWRADTYQAMSGSRTWLGKAVKGVKHPAVVLDIDNTSLASHYAWGRPVPVTLRFVKYAVARDVTILFVTGRRATERKAAIAQLRKAGFRVDALCGRNKGEGLAAGKQRCRAYYTKRGHVILANVGNRRTDLAGGNYQRGFKLPDYDKQLS